MHAVATRANDRARARIILQKPRRGAGLGVMLVGKGGTIVRDAFSEDLKLSRFSPLPTVRLACASIPM